MKKLVVANWKMNPQSLEEARKLASQIEHAVTTINRSNTDVVVCPPFVFLPGLRHTLHFARVGAQNIAGEEKGPHTGEVSGQQLRGFNVSCVIVGHSERRSLGEDDNLVNQKMKQAIKNNFEPVLCVGFGTKKSSSVSSIKKIIGQQLRNGLKGISTAKDQVAIAYEPVWAISRGLGTGEAVRPEHAAEIIDFIHEEIPRVRVLYGGSVDAKNVAGFAFYEQIQGGLVGGASLQAGGFIQIIKAFN